MGSSCGKQTGPRRARDSSPTSVPGDCSSYPTDFCQHGDEVLFQAKDETHGQELWKTDGTPLGTQLVLDIRPGPDSGGPSMFARLGHKVLIDVLGPDYSHELWTTDGTPAGTRFVREISPARATAAQGRWRVVGSLAFFALDDGVSGSELWATDGTYEGTRLVKDIAPGPEDGVSLLSSVVLDGMLYFPARSGTGSPPSSGGATERAQAPARWGSSVPVIPWPPRVAWSSSMPERPSAGRSCGRPTAGEEARPPFHRSGRGRWRTGAAASS